MGCDGVCLCLCLCVCVSVSVSVCVCVSVSVSVVTNAAAVIRGESCTAGGDQEQRAPFANTCSRKDVALASISAPNMYIYKHAIEERQMEAHNFA